MKCLFLSTDFKFQDAKSAHFMPPTYSPWLKMQKASQLVDFRTVIRY